MQAEIATCVVVLEFPETWGLGFVGPSPGLITTCFHVVVGETKVTAHFADGRALPVRKVVAIDVRRDLAVLDVGVPVASPLVLGPTRLVDEGEPLVSFGLVPGARRVRWVDASVGSLQVLGPALTALKLEGQLPSDGSGSPLLSAKGELIGVHTVAETPGGAVSLGIPSRYLPAMWGSFERSTLEVLRPPAKRSVKREVPQHAMTILDGSSAKGLEQLLQGIAGAIRQGAPAYNQGDHERCFRVYEEAARRLVRTRDDCPGPQAALLEGLKRAESMSDSDGRAWALRDAFDGLLAVIEKWFKAQGSMHRPGGAGPKGPVLPN